MFNIRLKDSSELYLVNQMSVLRLLRKRLNARTFSSADHTILKKTEL